MPTEQVLESQKKIAKNVDCPKCHDSKKFMNKLGEIKTCLEC